MQNSGLASALALQFFTPEAALPGVVAAVWANITGAVIAALVRRKPSAGDSGPRGESRLSVSLTLAPGGRQTRFLCLPVRWEIGQPNLK
ncbi:hypothetical protein HMPREF2724_07070 [Corynebacterium sp. HMSC071F07]|nr:hypothetical protein HMPREF2724_07070 [Corynebacterium sp. HMSC071F07]